MSSDRERAHPANQQPEPARDGEPSRWSERLPAIDPNTAPTPSAAPPVDIDDRHAAIPHADPPDVIELSDPGEPAAPDGDFPEFHPEDATEESPDAATVELQEAWQSDTYIDPDTVESSSSSSTDTTREDLTIAPGADTSRTVVTVDSQTPGTVNGSNQPPGPARTVTLQAERDTHSDADDPHIHETVIDDRPREELGGASGAIERFGTGSLQQFIQPFQHLRWTTSQRLVVLGGALLILLALLASSAGLALLIAGAVVSIVIVLGLSQRDVFEHESAALIMGVGGIGGIIGIVVGTLGSWVTSSSWFDSGRLNYGAAGFGGRFADAAGSAPFAVWLLNGLIFSLIALAAIAVAPVALRRMPQFRNEVMDGVILVGASAAGFTIGTTLIYSAPMLGDRGPQTSVRDWTLTMIGVVLLRPVVITLAGAMLGAAIWRYMSSPRLSTIILPAAGSIGAYLLLVLGSIQLGPAGLWPETIWTLLIAAVTVVLYRTVFKTVIASDQSVLGKDGTRIVCPTCGQLTPPGTFCANCGNALPKAAAADASGAPGNAPVSE